MTDRDRLIKLLIKLGVTWNTCNVADKILADGWMKPPCKVGDTVWYITGIYGTVIKSAIVKEIIITADTENGISELTVEDKFTIFTRSFDTFFLTKEEAEKALKEREGK